ncbi:MAG TPA: ATP-dependent DNA helicase RecG [Gemmatimonadales bacterium]|nr:ATP-dependent DNA helicase RecG [Gemmatimonadales bacterium]
MSTLRLSTSAKYLKGVGPRRAEALARLGIHSVGDLLYHAPHRYLDATTVTPLGKVHVGDEVTCVGRVVSTGVLPTRRGLRVFHAVLRDENGGGGPLECAWPGQPFLERQIRKGQLLLVTGPVRYYHGGQLVPREFVILADEGETGPERGLVLPVYPATEGLTHRQIRGLLHQHLDALLALVDDPHPRALRAANALPELRAALAAVHRPADVAEAEAGRRRLAFDELFDQQLVQARARALAKRARGGIAFVLKKELTTRLKEHLPFELTADQRRAIREIADDMTAPLRMHRLLMGDVGTGKTVVALFAMLLAVENDYQAAIMAPTELLAEQHVATLTRLLEPLALKPDLLIGRLTPADKAAARERIARGASRLIVGTHALIQESVRFQRLGLAVIDEQHRFGVEQRAALVEKGDAPDVLLLTATPIPRSLALTLYGDLDVTELRERPPGRGTVKTALRTEAARQKIYEFIRAECAAGGGGGGGGGRGGRQAYVIYPVIDESERADLKAATTMAGRLAKVYPELTVGLVHGRLKPEEREATMRAFRDGAVHILVATSVVEVGIDVANATVMVIEHAERFGLAQLHQLRGRVGRGGATSHCILLSDVPEAATRLRAFTETTDGFRIAELDLQERGMGVLAGARQSGGTPLRYANFATDLPLLEAARRAAGDIIARDPTLALPPHAAYRERIVSRYERGFELFRVG